MVSGIRLVGDTSSISFINNFTYTLSIQCGSSAPPINLTSGDDSTFTSALPDFKNNYIPGEFLGAFIVSTVDSRVNQTYQAFIPMDINLSMDSSVNFESAIIGENNHNFTVLSYYLGFNSWGSVHRPDFNGSSKALIRRNAILQEPQKNCQQNFSRIGHEQAYPCGCFNQKILLDC